MADNPTEMAAAVAAAVADIAAQLGETKSYAIEQLERVVATLGVAAAYDFLEQTKSRLAEDESDRLIVEGYPALDKKLGVVGLLAQSVTTTRLQAAKWAGG